MSQIKNFMKSNMGKFKEVFSFAIVGCINTGVDFLAFTLLHMVFGLGAVISQGISYFLGILNSYVMNRTWTFKVKTKISGMEFLKFAIVNGLSWGVSILIIFFFEGLPVNIFVGKVAASLCALVINFLGSKLFVFK